MFTLFSSNCVKAMLFMFSSPLLPAPVRIIHSSFSTFHIYAVPISMEFEAALFLIEVLFFFLASYFSCVGSYFLDQRLNLCPLRWNLGLWITRGSSESSFFKFYLLFGCARSLLLEGFYLVVASGGHSLIERYSGFSLQRLLLLQERRLLGGGLQSLQFPCSQAQAQ